MRTYVTILAGRTVSEVRPVVSSADPAVVEATLRAIRKQAIREAGADAARAEAERSLRAAEPALRELHRRALEQSGQGDRCFSDCHVGDSSVGGLRHGG